MSCCLAACTTARRCCCRSGVGAAAVSHARCNSWRRATAATGRAAGSSSSEHRSRALFRRSRPGATVSDSIAHTAACATASTGSNAFAPAFATASSRHSSGTPSGSGDAPPWVCSSAAIASRSACVATARWVFLATEPADAIPRSDSAAPTFRSATARTAVLSAVGVKGTPASFISSSSAMRCGTSPDAAASSMSRLYTAAERRTPTDFAGAMWCSSAKPSDML
mmetsp:Transcript_15577/g.48207  ORF Transcript_15577/g.48207 Transcript_15577/m.48207 type:complete len:224 (+) Transcript_15577:709-1380(+)